MGVNVTFCSLKAHPAYTSSKVPRSETMYVFASPVEGIHRHDDFRPEKERSGDLLSEIRRYALTKTSTTRKDKDPMNFKE